MKLTIDKTAKTISIDCENLGELFSELESLLPNGEWKTYRLHMNPVFAPSYPIIYPICPQPYFPFQPYYTLPNTFVMTNGTATCENPTLTTNANYTSIQ